MIASFMHQIAEAHVQQGCNAQSMPVKMCKCEVVHAGSNAGKTAAEALQ